LSIPRRLQAQSTLVAIVDMGDRYKPRMYVGRGGLRHFETVTQVSVRVALDREHMLERRQSRIAASSRIAIVLWSCYLVSGRRRLFCRRAALDFLLIVEQEDIDRVAEGLREGIFPNS
jgi:hypothetical protein